MAAGRGGVGLRRVLQACRQGGRDEECGGRQEYGGCNEFGGREECGGCNEFGGCDERLGDRRRETRRYLPACPRVRPLHLSPLPPLVAQKVTMFPREMFPRENRSEAARGSSGGLRRGADAVTGWRILRAAACQWPPGPGLHLPRTRPLRHLPKSTAGRGAWRSSVARLLWEQEVAGSNPAAPTTGTPGRSKTSVSSRRPPRRCDRSRELLHLTGRPQPHEPNVGPARIGHVREHVAPLPPVLANDPDEQ